MPMDFMALGIRPELAETLHKSGIKEPTPVQDQAIPPLLAGKDVIGQAQTGTGKTLAFLLPILQTIDPARPDVQALILTPTRELAIQITAEAKKLAAVIGANVMAAYGGQDVDKQVRKLEGGTQIVVATPGRLLDHLERGAVSLHKVRLLVLDEADQMLHLGFLEEVEQLILRTAKDRQMMLFSATMPEQVKALAKRYMKKPVVIEVTSRRVTLDEIHQVVIETSEQNKPALLIEQLKEANAYLAVVFCRTKSRADEVTDALQREGFATEALHGDLSQAKREQVMRRFREAKLQVLVATDVAARGIDVEGVSHVINYDMPHDVESYIHRIGRTGRAGQTGVAITFATHRDRDALALIEKGIASRIERHRAKIAAGDAQAAANKARPGRGAAAAAANKPRPARLDRPEGVSRRQWAAMQTKKEGAAKPGGGGAKASARPRRPAPRGK